MTLERKIVEWPRDKAGLYVQPSECTPDLEVVMNHNRMRFANQFDLADTHGFGNSHTFDPKGRYNCGDCNQYKRAGNDCLVIEDIDSDDINREASSCRHFEEPCAGDPESPLKRTTKAAALFGTAKNGKGFGCERCGYYRKGKWKDSLERPGWCGAGYFTTEPTVCCAINSAPTLEDDDSDEGSYKKTDKDTPMMAQLMRRRLTRGT